MRLVVLDTDVFSFFFKHDTRAQLYADDVAGAHPCISFQTLAELQVWAITRRWGEQRRRRLAEVLEHYLLFPSDEQMVRHRAVLTAHRRSLGREIGCGDAWIAATALRHDAALLTHNAADFADVPGLNVITHGA